MSNMKLVITHGETVFQPPIVDGVKIEWERVGSAGKMTFTTIKVNDATMSFDEGDKVCFYYDDKPVFLGYVFTKKRDRKQQIQVTCYDQIRYLKNKYTYLFEKKTATQIVKSLCDDFELNIGSIDNTSYVIPAIAEENKSALDIILDVLEETLANTGNMFVLYDDAGKLQLKNCANMISNTLIMQDTAEDFDYTTTIDDETYNSIVLYYDENSNGTTKNTVTSSNISGSSSYKSQVQSIVQKAVSQIGTTESPKGSNDIKYNDAYYGSSVSGGDYPWCCVFVWWVFKECGLSNLFCGGSKVASCERAAQYYKDQGQWVTSGYKPGDIVFFNFGRGISHVGIVESVNGKKVTCIEGNLSDKVGRMTRTSDIVGAGRPSYSASRMASSDSSSDSSNSTTTSDSTKNSGIKIFTAQSPSRIKQWGLLRYFEKVDNPSIGQNKANALLKLYNRKTRELKVTGAFGDTSIRGGTLIPVKLNLGDVVTNNYMLVEKVTHNFETDHYTMDLTLEGEWNDGSSDIVSKTVPSL